MIKIYLPINNDNIDIYFNTREANNDLTKLNREELNKILELSLGRQITDYEVVFENRNNGQYIIIETDREKKWITLSADYTRVPGDTGSTNAYFVQFIPMAIADYFLNETNKNKSLELYLKGTSHNRAKTPAQQIYYRLAKTVGIKILNEFEFETTIRRNIAFPFENIEEWKKSRLGMASANSGNKSSYIIENDDSYVFYGKTFGANGRESIFLLYVLANLAKNEDKKIYLYEVSDNGTFRFESSSNEEDQKFKRVLKSLGVNYYADSVNYVENEEVETLSDDNKSARYQAEFMRNLLYKFNSKKDANGNVVYGSNGKPIVVDDIKRCYLCDCDIQRLIIASHIHRVTDIDKLDIPFSEKRKLAVDADNGLWLCANHDKLFEYGLIYFKDNVLKISDNLTEKQKKYVKYLTFDIKKKIQDINNSDVFMVAEDSVPYGSTESYALGENIFMIDKCDYNENMHNYLEIHKERTQVS